MHEVGSHLQLELCNLQCDTFLLTKSGLPIDQFWSLIDKDNYPNPNIFGLRILSMFGSTYLYEAGFSHMEIIKSTERYCISQESLEACLRLALKNIQIDTTDLISQKKLKIITSLHIKFDAIKV